MLYVYITTFSMYYYILDTSCIKDCIIRLSFALTLLRGFVFIVRAHSKNVPVFILNRSLYVNESLVFGQLANLHVIAYCMLY